MDKDLFFVLLGAFSFIVGVVVLAYFAQLAACNDVQKSTSYETKNTFFGGCYVKVNDKWTPQENWIVEEN